jgi:23S rRNA (uracil1939-C5)-methyltransferase
MTVEQWIAVGAAGGPFDSVIVDPPRAGLAADVRAWLASAHPRTLVYVSCNPVTLARDLGELTRGGYEIDGLRLFDFYPQTSHVESVATLRA